MIKLLLLAVIAQGQIKFEGSVSAPVFSKVEGATQKAISLSPAITEIIYYMGLQGMLVGTTEHSDFPEEAKKLTTVGPYGRPDYEKILSLKPNLVLVPNEGPQEIQKRLKSTKLPLAVVRMRRLNEIPDAGKLIGWLLGNGSIGESFHRAWHTKLEQIKSSLKKPKTKPIVFVQIQTSPLMGVGQNTFIDDMITFCGGENALKEQEGYAKSSVESTLIKRITHLVLAEHFQTPEIEARTKNDWLKFRPKGDLKIIKVDPNTFTRPGPRLIKSIEQLCQDLRN
ncbi:MAG: ABC transporter substrate-binding protein [Oligoflexia bacterium]|nr:ABC transporter substrate-binding protein [Oligoflexia bacterium]